MEVMYYSEKNNFERDINSIYNSENIPSAVVILNNIYISLSNEKQQEQASNFYCLLNKLRS